MTLYGLLNTMLQFMSALGLMPLVSLAVVLVAVGMLLAVLRRQ